MAHERVAGELYESITGQLFEIARQLRQPSGYPFDAEALQAHLQTPHGSFRAAASTSRASMMAAVRASTGLTTTSTTTGGGSSRCN